MNSKKNFTNVNFVEVVKSLQDSTSALEKLWESIIGHSPCIPCLTLYLHRSNISPKAGNLIRLLHNPLGHQHLLHVNEIQSEIEDVIKEALKRNPDVFKCKHLDGKLDPRKQQKGCN